MAQLKTIIFLILVLVCFESNAQNEGRLISFRESNLKLGDSLIIYPVMRATGFLRYIENQPILDLLVVFLERNDSLIVDLELHTDSRGGNEYNLVLSQKRSDSLAAFIVRKGIAPTRIIPVGKGECCPLYTDQMIASRDSEEERESLFAINRRVVVKVKEIN